jgi:hypothetical protein
MDRRNPSERSAGRGRKCDGFDGCSGGALTNERGTENSGAATKAAAAGGWLHGNALLRLNQLCSCYSRAKFCNDASAVCAHATRRERCGWCAGDADEWARCRTRNQCIPSNLRRRLTVGAGLPAMSLSRNKFTIRMEASIAGKPAPTKSPDLPVATYLR